MSYAGISAFLATLTLLFGCSTSPSDPAPATATATEVASVPALVPARADPPVRLLYGGDKDNFGDLYLPDNGEDSLPVVVMVHGGGWQSRYDLSYFGPLAQAVAARGIAVWNIEYRRSAKDFRTTLADVDKAMDALATTAQEVSGGRLDLDRVHIAGHSAGGQLAAWIAGRHPESVTVTGPRPRVRLRSATIMAGVFDMARAATIGGDKFVPAFLGGMPDQVPDRYRLASPIDRLPTGLEVTAIHGDADTTVSVNQSKAYIEAARAAGDLAELRILPGLGHSDFVRRDSMAWSTTLDTITEHTSTLH